MTAPTWAILIPTIGQRRDLFLRLMDRLLPQLDAHAGRVRVLAWFNHGQPMLGDLRDQLMLDAGTDYVSFIDDDDLVSEDYVAEIVKALTSKPDHVGFRLEFTTNGRGREIVEHSLKWGRWGRSADGMLFRDFTHIDPIRRELAIKGSFRTIRPHHAEDRQWVKSVRGTLHSEEFIPKVLYHYLWDERVTAWQRPRDLDITNGRHPVEHPFFSWHPESAP
jgi:hypothetical protein